MPTGRCAGCGYSGSCTKVKMHVLVCPDFLAVFRENPERCLHPAAEYARFKAEDDTSEARAERRDQRLRHRFAEMERLAAIQAARWQRPKDILED